MLLSSSFSFLQLMLLVWSNSWRASNISSYWRSRHLILIVKLIISCRLRSILRTQIWYLESILKIHIALSKIRFKIGVKLPRITLLSVLNIHERLLFILRCLRNRYRFFGIIQRLLVWVSEIILRKAFILALIWLKTRLLFKV